jgi:hypothetical protein
MIWVRSSASFVDQISETVLELYSACQSFVYLLHREIYIQCGKKSTYHFHFIKSTYHFHFQKWRSTMVSCGLGDVYVGKRLPKVACGCSKLIFVLLPFHSLASYFCLQYLSDMLMCDFFLLSIT